MRGPTPAEADLVNQNDGAHPRRDARLANSYSTDYNSYSCRNRIIASCYMLASRRVSPERSRDAVARGAARSRPRHGSLANPDITAHGDPAQRDVKRGGFRNGPIT